MSGDPRAELEGALRRRGAQPTLRGHARTRTANEVLGDAGRAAAALARAGVVPGEPVAVCVRDPAAAVPVVLALWRGGHVAFPLHPRDPERNELAARARCRLVLDDEAARALVADRWSGALAGVPAPVLEGAGTVLGTSGTSGRRKLVVHTLARHLASARGLAGLARLRAGDCWLLALPLHHVAGLAVIVRAVLAEASVAIADPPRNLVQSLDFFRPTHASVVSTQLVRLLADEHGARLLGGLRTVLAGGGPVSVPLRRWALGAGVPLVVGYASTEAASTIAATRDPELLMLEGRVGSALPGRRVRIGEGGVIEVAGDTLLEGYLQGDTVEDPRGADGWLATGDTGVIDDRGLVVLGRRDAMFVCGGENVYPARVERVLAEHAAVGEVVVVPVPDAEFGARPVAFLRVPGEEGAGVEELARTRLAPFERPVAWYDLGQVSEAGVKPDRGRLAALVADDRQREELRRAW